MLCKSESVKLVYVALVQFLQKERKEKGKELGRGGIYLLFFSYRRLSIVQCTVWF